jgi:hypothetical protein
MVAISSSRVRPETRLWRIVAAFSGVGLGVAAGLAGLSIFAALAIGGDAPAPSLPAGRLIDAAHVPPLLRAAGERVQLRYDVYCAPVADDPDTGCDASGTAYVRPGSEGAFRAVPLRFDAAAAEGRYVADVPADVAADADGFSYYAVLRNDRSGASLTLPAGGADAPQRSLPLGRAVEVELGPHVFGGVRAAAERVFSASWGHAQDAVGLLGGRQTAPVGPASFDVDDRGRLTLLDQVNRRLLRVDARGAAPSAVPLEITSAAADLAVDDDGTAYVLESGAADPGPELRTFTPDGRLRALERLAERTASQIRLGPSGPVVKQYPGEQWLPAVEGGVPLDRATQARHGSPARPLQDGREVTVLRAGNDVRLALSGGDGPRRTWVVHSGTPVAEVQLVEPLGNRLAVVLRLYTDDRDEFEALVLGPKGVERRFSLASADWAETAPLSRFRLAGGSLYQLGSTPAGVHVDRFDLDGVQR